MRRTETYMGASSPSAASWASKCQIDDVAWMHAIGMIRATIRGRRGLIATARFERSRRAGSTALLWKGETGTQPAALAKDQSRMGASRNELEL